MMKHVGVYLVLFSFVCFACNKNDGDKTGTYNGFKVDGVTYQVDSIEHSFYTTLRPLKIHSKDNGGGAIYIHTMPNMFPTADGTYQFHVKAVRHDSMDVDVCFESDDRTMDYCALEGLGGQSLSTLTITIMNGKWSVSLPSTTIYDNSAKTLEVAASE
jgi:hypothetical protein